MSRTIPILCLSGAVLLAGAQLALAQTKVPATYAAPSGSIDTSKRGFRVRTVQANFNLGNTITRGENQLGGTLIDPNTNEKAQNLADPFGLGADGYFVEEGVINYNQDAPGAQGNFGAGRNPPFDIEDKPIPGIPGIEGSTDNFSQEILGFMQVTKGKYRFGVNSDDGFNLTVGVGNNPADKFAVSVGQFNGGRGASDTQFDVEFEADGIYPIRLIWFEGLGGANAEFFSMDPPTSAGTRILVNDPNNAKSVKVFREASGAKTPFAKLVTPFPGQANVFPSDPIKVELQDGDVAVTQGSVKLSLNGSDVTPKVTKAGNVTTVEYTFPTIPASGASHKAALSYTFGSTTVTREWSFTTQKYATLSPADKVTPDTSKRGFIWRVNHNGTVAAENNHGRAELQLAGKLKDGDGNFILNLADPFLFGGADGPTTFPTPPQAPITFEVSKVINFSQAEGDMNGNFTPDLGMPGIPGIEGSTDRISADIITLVDLPAGLVTMGVNSDDGFLTQVGRFGALADELAPSPRFAGEFNGGRGAADTIYPIVVQEAGVYPLRTLWYEGNGGANIEWFTVKADGSKVLLNDDANGGFKTYRAILPSALKAVGRNLAPANNSGGAAPDGEIKLELVDGAAPIDRATVSMKLNGAAVPATINKSGSVTTISYKPAAALPLATKQTVSLSYTEGGSPVTREYSFTTLNKNILAYWDFNDSSDSSFTRDKVGRLPGTLLGGAKYSADAAGRTGKAGDLAMDFGPDAGGQTVLVEDASFLNLAGAQDQVTFSFWQKWTEDVANSSAFWAASPGSSGTQRGAQVHSPWGNSTVYFDTAGCCNAWQRLQSNIDTLPTFTGPEWWKSWQHFAFVKKGEDKQFWINGTLFLEGKNVAPLPRDFVLMNIGSQLNGGNSMKGMLDDFAVFAEALTPAEIGRLAKGESPDQIRVIAAPGAKFTGFRRDGANIVLEWSGGGTLQSADSVTGPWADVAGASSPRSIAISGAGKFYRVKQ